MNNPFSRFKHYITEENNQEENHATECLAACLVFSQNIRLAFVKFLMPDAGAILADEDGSQIDVITQRTVKGGFIDLVLQKSQVFTIAVEVKVSAGEDEHHRHQLKTYKQWLDGFSGQTTKLFTLVKSPDSSFDYKSCDVDERYTWRNLFNYLKKLESISAIEKILISNFCEYLEREGIVSTYTTTDLFNYHAGLSARKAVIGILNQVSHRLKNKSEADEKKDTWPGLKFDLPEQTLFGQTARPRLQLWFTVPGIWNAPRHDFAFSILLWNENDAYPWEATRVKIPKWRNVLESNGFTIRYFEAWSKFTMKIPNKGQPKQVDAWIENQSFLDQKSPQSEDQLVNRLAEQAKHYQELLTSLEK